MYIKIYTFLSELKNINVNDFAYFDPRPRHFTHRKFLNVILSL